MSNTEIKAQKNLFEQTRKTLKKEHSRSLPWFASLTAVFIITIICAVYDGLNLYQTFSVSIRGHYIISIVTAIGATLMLNFGMSILAYMVKSKKQGLDDISIPMIIIFALIMVCFFGVIFVYRWSVADMPFQTVNVTATLDGSSGVEEETQTVVSSLTKYAFCTLINISSLASSAICYAVSYYNCNPQAKHKLAKQEQKIDFAQQQAVAKAYAKRLDSFSVNELDNYEKDKLNAANDRVIAIAIEEKEALKNELQKHCKNPSEVSAISENVKPKTSNYTRVTDDFEEDKTVVVIKSNESKRPQIVEDK